MTGTLSDREIESSGCISENFEHKNVKQACYELRAGSTYYDLTVSQDPINIGADETILIKPGHLVAIITMEELDLPEDMLGRILTKGAFFSLGLSPVNTYADPGFKGKLGVVVHNCSSNYISLPQGENIAKLELSRLSEPVAKRYSGQHGFETQIWPIRRELILKPKEIKNDPRINSPIEELQERLGSDFSLLTKKVFGWERRILFGVFCIMALNFFLMGIMTHFDASETAKALGIGMLVNISMACFMWFLTGVRRKK